MFSAVADGFGFLFGWLPNLLQWMLNGIWAILKPVTDLIGAIFYLLYKLGVVLVKVLQLVVSVGKMLIGLVTGLFKTIMGFGYTGKPAQLPGSYHAVFAKIMPIINGLLQLDKVAYLFVFGIWITAAFYAIKIIGEMRGAGGSD